MVPDAFRKVRTSTLYFKYFAGLLYWDIFINMRKRCGHWKNREKQFFIVKCQVSLRELKFSGNMYFSYTERLASVKVEKVFLLQRNDQK